MFSSLIFFSKMRQVQSILPHRRKKAVSRQDFFIRSVVWNTIKKRGKTRRVNEPCTASTTFLWVHKLHCLWCRSPKLSTPWTPLIINLIYSSMGVTSHRPRTMTPLQACYHDKLVWNLWKTMKWGCYQGAFTTNEGILPSQVFSKSVVNNMGATNDRFFKVCI